MSDKPPISPRSPRVALEPEPLPPPPKRSERARSPIVVFGNAIMTLLLVSLLGAGGAFVYGRQKIEAPGPLEADKIVNIPSRAGVTDIADVLQREGVIDSNRWAFIGGVFALQVRSDLKPGEYLFPKKASLREVIDTIVDGKVVQHSVTIPEGLTSEQIVQRLTENDIFTGSIREIPREGTLLPETYKFPRGAPREQVIQRMQQAQKRALADIWERRSPEAPVKTVEQLVTLASIVEKETGRADERSRVASVFTNRIRLKMRLQSDPTIIYGLVGGKGTLGRPIRRSEIQQPSPYNTYVIDGLPPGPIANPGRASLEATANPARTRDLFFVADGTGGHAFTETYAEHQKHVAKLRASERQTQNDALEPAAEPAPAPAPAVEAPAAPDASTARPAQQKRQRSQAPARQSSEAPAAVAPTAVAPAATQTR